MCKQYRVDQDLRIERRYSSSSGFSITTEDLSRVWQASVLHCTISPDRVQSGNGLINMEAFETLKRIMTSPPVLAYPNAKDQFILDTDASDLAIGAVLSQVQDGKERPISFANKALNSKQKQYCTTRKELLAVVAFTQHYEHYLLGRPFLIRTDHASLA